MSRISEIIVADDDKTVRTVILNALNKHGYSVGGATSAASMWDIVTSGKGKLLITDVCFPDGDALDLLPKLKNKRPDLRIIIMSARTNLLTAIKSQVHGVFEYLPKPFELKELIRVVDIALKSDQKEEIDVDIISIPKVIPPPLTGNSSSMQDTYKLISKLSAYNVPILISAEKGSMKKNVAKTIFEMSNYNNGSFNYVDFLETSKNEQFSTLFDNGGLIYKSKKGCLFLNNIENATIEVQKKLFKYFNNLIYKNTLTGMPKYQNLEFKLIIGSTLNLNYSINQKKIFEELLVLFSGGLINIPPLRNRKEDIRPLLEFFCNYLNKEFSKEKIITDDIVKFLEDYNWPGNVRELEYVFKKAFFENIDENLNLQHFKNQNFKKTQNMNLVNNDIQTSDESFSDLVKKQISNFFNLLGKDKPPPNLYNRIVSEVEKPLITSTLFYTNGNQLKAAKILGINRNTLRKKILDLKISSKKSDYLK